MAYRGDGEAEAARLRALTAEMAELDRRLAERNVLRAHRERVSDQLNDATKAAAHRRAKVPIPLLARIRVASPCHERWDKMSGDERVRHCAACDKDVYDLSEMTSAEAEDLLQTVGEAACVRLHRRADGTVITSDCPVGAKRKRRTRWIAAGAGIAGGAMATASALLAVNGVEKAPVTAVAQPAFAMGVVMAPVDEHESMVDYETVPFAGGPMFVEIPEEGDGDAPADEERVAPIRHHHQVRGR